jgi:hypothetical protein
LLFLPRPDRVQEYLPYKKTPPPRTLPWSLPRDLEGSQGGGSGVSTPSRDSQSDFTQVTSTYDQASTSGPARAGSPRGISDLTCRSSCSLSTRVYSHAHARVWHGHQRVHRRKGTWTKLKSNHQPSRQNQIVDVQTFDPAFQLSTVWKPYALHP